MRPPRLRGRLILTFALVAALSSVVLAVTSYVAVSRNRLTAATDDAIAQSRANLVLAAESLPRPASEAELRSFTDSLQRRGAFEVLALQDGEVFRTSVSLTPDLIPGELVQRVAEGRIAATRLEVGDLPFVVVGGAVQPDGVVLYAFHPLQRVFDDLAALRTVLAVVAAGVVAASAAVGMFAAAELLRPIARARDGARRLAGGELATRIPDAGRDEFAELSRSFNEMAAALERTVGDLRQLEASHRRFVADVSHELRTPLTALTTAADVLDRHAGDLDPTGRRAARILGVEARRLGMLVEDLMEISRIDAGVASMRVERVDLRRAARGAVESRGWAGEVTVEADEVTVPGDARRLDAVIGNLVANARRHGAPPVTVGVRGGDGVAVLTVSDAGPGIAAEHLPHLFDRFYKADPARPRSEGSGLGLAIVAENVALHDGTVSVDSREGWVTCFTVTLPLAPDESGVVSQPLPGGDPAAMVTAHGGAISPHEP